ncbi:MAG TPA: hypothetical protein VN133_07255 [Humibacter sp.]|nr:hypothetical protein [Humibacter sp.]
MPRPITPDDVDHARESALVGDPRTAAERFRAWATDARAYTLADGVSRAALLADAGEYFGYADDHDEAVRMFEAAIADGGPVAISPRVMLVRELFQAGRTEDAFALADELRRERSAGVTDYILLGSGFELIGENKQAQRWYAMGLRAIDSGSILASEFDYESLLIGRQRVRSNAGMPEDALDAAARAIMARHAQE